MTVQLNLDKNCWGVNDSKTYLNTTKAKKLREASCGSVFRKWPHGWMEGIRSPSKYRRDNGKHRSFSLLTSWPYDPSAQCSSHLDFSSLPCNRRETQEAWEPGWAEQISAWLCFHNPDCGLSHITQYIEFSSGSFHVDSAHTLHFPFPTGKHLNKTVLLVTTYGNVNDCYCLR